MISRFFEALLRPVFALAGTLMANLFLAPFRALSGGARDDEDDEEAPDELEGDQPPRLPPPKDEDKPQQPS